VSGMGIAYIKGDMKKKKVTSLFPLYDLEDVRKTILTEYPECWDFSPLLLIDSMEALLNASQEIVGAFDKRMSRVKIEELVLRLGVILNRVKEVDYQSDSGVTLDWGVR